MYKFEIIEEIGNNEYDEMVEKDKALEVLADFSEQLLSYLKEGELKTSVTKIFKAKIQVNPSSNEKEMFYIITTDGTFRTTSERLYTKLSEIIGIFGNKNNIILETRNTKTGNIFINLKLA